MSLGMVLEGSLTGLYVCRGTTLNVMAAATLFQHHASFAMVPQLAMLM